MDASEVKTVAAASAGPGGTFRAFAHPAYRQFFVAFLVAQTGFWISHVSLQALMVELGNNDTRLNGLLFFCNFAPSFLLAPMAGVAADRFHRKPVMLACYAALVVVTAVLTVATASGELSVVALVGLASCMGVALAFMGPASISMAANVVPRADLASAVSLHSAATNLTRVAGPLLAAPLLIRGWFDISFGIYCCALFAALVLTVRMAVERHQPDADESGMWARMRAGMQHAKQRHPAVPALSIVAVLAFFGVSHTVLLPAVAYELLGDKEYFAWMVAATGAGAIVGSLTVGRLASSPSLVMAGGLMVVYGAALLVFALVPTLTVALITQAIIGCSYFAAMTSIQTLLQQLVDESKRGRVMSLFSLAWGGLVPFGALGTSFFAAATSLQLSLVGGAVVCVLYGVGMLLWAARQSPGRLAADGI